jgi:glycine cleavage system H protein
MDHRPWTIENQDRTNSMVYCPWSIVYLKRFSPNLRKFVRKILILRYDFKNKKYKKMTFPENLKYTKEHEWIKVSGNEAIVGITEFATSELGDIVFVEIETVGESLSAGETFGTVEAVKTVSDLFMPVSGEIIEVNPKLEQSPEIVNKDPYGQGWIIKIKITDVAGLNNLLDPVEYKKLIG